MVSQEALNKLIARLSLLPYFPADQGQREVLIDLILEFAETDEQLEWLGRRALKLYTEWPGAHELRAAFCSRYKPKDNYSISSTVYSEGIPSERPAESKLPALPPGHVASADPTLEASVRALAETKSLNRRGGSGK